MKTLISIPIFLSILGLASPCGLHAALPEGVTLKPVFESDGKNRFTRPVCMQEIPGKPGHFLVAEHAGKIHALVPAAGGGYTKTEFVRLAASPAGTKEQGFYSIALHPAFASNRKYYVNYAPLAATGLHLVVEEREADSTLLKDSGKPPRVLLSFPTITGSFNHNHGTLAFGPDGMLYLSLGYGGNDGDTRGWAQDLGQLMGKVLRLDVDGTSSGLPYRIPADNPFVGRAGARGEIWAYGFRNPWRISWDMKAGNLWVGDVGERTLEEVDIVRKGDNLGWNTMEGDGCFQPAAGCGQTGLVKPVKSLTRTEAISVIGGVVFRGDSTSAFYGAYIFGENGLPKIWALTQADRVLTEFKLLIEPPAAPLSFFQDSKNAIYVLTPATIYQLVHPELRPASATVALARPGLEGPAHMGNGGNRGLAGLFAKREDSYIIQASPTDAVAWELYSLDGRKVAAGNGTRIRTAPGTYYAKLRTGAGSRTGLVWLE